MHAAENNSPSRDLTATIKPSAFLNLNICFTVSLFGRIPNQRKSTLMTRIVIQFAVISASLSFSLPSLRGR